MSLDQNKNKRFRALANEAGQGTIEYILVIVVVIAIVAGGLYQLNQAFASFANNLFGEYLSCLLETGELPALGNPDDSASSTCAQFFAAFDESEAQGDLESRIGTDGGGSGGSNGGGSNGSSSGGASDRSAQSSMNDRNGRSGRSGTVVASSGSRGGGRFGRNRGWNQGQTRNSSLGGKSSSDEEIGTGNTGVSSYGFGNERSGAPKRQKAKFLDSSFNMGRNEQEEREAPIKTKSKTVSSHQKKKDEVFMIERKVASKGKIREDDGFSFGDMIRYFIIAAIIIAIVVFFGGQIAQMSNEMD